MNCTNIWTENPSVPKACCPPLDWVLLLGQCSRSHNTINYSAGSKWNLKKHVLCSMKYFSARSSVFYCNCSGCDFGVQVHSIAVGFQAERSSRLSRTCELFLNYLDEQRNILSSLVLSERNIRWRMLYENSGWIFSFRLACSEILLGNSVVQILKRFLKGLTLNSV